MRFTPVASRTLPPSVRVLSHWESWRESYEKLMTFLAHAGDTENLPVFSPQMKKPFQLNERLTQVAHAVAD